jgi:plastocyanin
VDRFGQGFSSPGLFKYGFGYPMLSQLKPAELQFTIDVKDARDRSREGRQHNVRVYQKGGQMMADPTNVCLEVNDVVLWYADDPATPGFSVSGYSETASFNSAALTHEALYIHPFVDAGAFDWGDENKHGVSGRVIVTMPPVTTPREIEAYQAHLAQPVLVLITGSSVEPAQVEVVVGQSVVFVVEEASGITITGKRPLDKVSTPPPPVY